VIEQVIPACSNSRVMAERYIALPTMVAEIDGKEQTFTGCDTILSFLDDTYSTMKRDNITNENSAEKKDDDVLKVIVNKATYLLTYVPGVLRSGRGISVCTAASIAFDVPRPAGKISGRFLESFPA